MATTTHQPDYTTASCSCGFTPNPAGRRPPTTILNQHLGRERRKAAQ